MRPCAFLQPSGNQPPSSCADRISPRLWKTGQAFGTALEVKPCADEGKGKEEPGGSEAVPSGSSADLCSEAGSGLLHQQMPLSEASAQYLWTGQRGSGWGWLEESENLS